MSDAPVAPVAPKNQTTIYFEHKSESDGRTYSGDFTFKRLTIGEIARAGVETARLNGGQIVDDATDYLNTIFATMKFAVVKAPEWWKPEDLYDGSIVIQVYKRYLEFEKSFRAAVSAASVGAPAASTGEPTK